MSILQKLERNSMEKKEENKKPVFKESIPNIEEVPEIVSKDEVADRVEAYWLDSVVPTLQSESGYFRIKKATNSIIIEPVKIETIDGSDIRLPTETINKMHEFVKEHEMIISDSKLIEEALTYFFMEEPNSFINDYKKLSPEIFLKMEDAIKRYHDNPNDDFFKTEKGRKVAKILSNVEAGGLFDLIK